MSRDLTTASCGRGFCPIRSGRRTRVNGTGKSFPLRAKRLQCKKKERKLNTKKCLITIVSALLMTAVMDAREKALNEREKTLAKRERSIANSTRRSREKAGAKAKQQQPKADSEEEQAKAAAS